MEEVGRECDRDDVGGGGADVIGMTRALGMRLRRPLWKHTYTSAKLQRGGAQGAGEGRDELLAGGHAE